MKNTAGVSQHNYYRIVAIREENVVAANQLCLLRPIFDPGE